MSGSVTCTRVPDWFAGDTDLGAVPVGDPAGHAGPRPGATSADSRLAGGTHAPLPWAARKAHALARIAPVSS